jgi:hypothetical protein
MLPPMTMPPLYMKRLFGSSRRKSAKEILPSFFFMAQTMGGGMALFGESLSISGNGTIPSFPRKNAMIHVLRMDQSAEVEEVLVSFLVLSFLRYRRTVVR